MSPDLRVLPGGRWEGRPWPTTEPSRAPFVHTLARGVGHPDRSSLTPVTLINILTDSLDSSPESLG